MIAWLLLQAGDPADLLRSVRARLSAVLRCQRSADPEEVTVCARRRADRYRVPFVEHDPGDPLWEGVPAERQRWLHRTTPIQDMGPFLVGGGAVGIGVTTGGGRSRVAGLRPLAP